MFKRFKQVFAVLFVLSAVLASVPAISANDSAFKTNMDGWSGMESTWNVTDDGYVDGAEQSNDDIALSDVYVDGTKDFTYTVHVKNTGGYGVGLVMGVKDKSTRDNALSTCLKYIVDPDNVHYAKNYLESGAVQSSVLGAVPCADRGLTGVSEYSLGVVYDADSGKAVFMLNGAPLHKATYDDTEALKGYLGLVAHGASIIATEAYYYEESASLKTNLTGIQGLDSSWVETPAGYMDGGEQSIDDIAVSDISFDGSKDFTYTVKLTKIAGYGAGLVLGVKDPSSRDEALKNYVYFIADPGTVYYKIFTDGVDGGPNGKGWSDLGYATVPNTYTLQAEYDAAAAVLSLYLNDELVIEINDAAAVVSGNIGFFAHDADVCILEAHYEIAGSAGSAGFDTNLEGWKGLDSTWTETDSGYKDGPEQTVNDFAVSNKQVDLTKNFTYTVKVKKTNGYGAGLVLGVKDISSRDNAMKNFIHFIADPSNVYYEVFTDGTGGGTYGAAHGVADLTEYTLSVKYDASKGVASFYFNDTMVATLEDKDVLSGYIGVYAHDANVYILSANYTESGSGSQPETDPGIINPGSGDSMSISAIAAVIVIGMFTAIRFTEKKKAERI